MLARVPATGGYSRDGCARLRREACNLQKLNTLLPDSQHIPRFVNFFDRDYPLLVMEYIDGRTLERELRDRDADRRFEPLLAASVVLALADVLAVAHGNNMLHRDIKPDNIMLRGATFTPVLLDLGISRDAENTTITNANEILGTPRYMSPEQIQGQELTNSSDIYSLGAVLFRMITGTNLFSDAEGEALRFRKLTADPTRTSMIVDSVPKKLDDIVDACLQRNPQNRYSDASSLASALRAFIVQSETQQWPLKEQLETHSQIRADKDYFVRLNEALQGQVILHKLVKREPTIAEANRVAFRISMCADLSGPFCLFRRLRFALQTRRLRHKLKINDPHAFMFEPPNWNADPVQFNVLTTDFATVSALRSRGINPFVLSANCLTFCQEDGGFLIVHKRTMRSATYPGALHTFGGAYLPHGVVPGKNDGSSLSTTAVREANEECRLQIRIQDNVQVCLCTELRTSFIEAMFFAEASSKDQFLKAQSDSNEEGTVHAVAFKDLLKQLLDPNNWVPTAWAHVMLWLGLGAPGLNENVRFGSDTARDLFEKVMRAPRGIQFSTDPMNPRGTQNLE